MAEWNSAKMKESMIAEEIVLESDNKAGENSARRNGMNNNAPGRRRRPPPADFMPFDNSE